MIAKCKQKKGFPSGTKNLALDQDEDLNFAFFGYEMFITPNNKGLIPVHFFVDESNKIESCYSYELFISSNLELALSYGKNHQKTYYDIGIYYQKTYYDIGISTSLDILQHNNNNIFRILTNASDENFKPGTSLYKYIFEALCKYFVEKPAKNLASCKDFWGIGGDSRKEAKQYVAEENKPKYLLLENNWNEIAYENNLDKEIKTQDNEDLFDKDFEEGSLQLDKLEIISVQFLKQYDDTNSGKTAKVISDAIEID